MATHSVSKRERKYGNKKRLGKIMVDKKKKIEEIQRLRQNIKHREAAQNINYYIETYGRDCYVLLEEGKLLHASEKFVDAKEKFISLIEDNADNKYYALYELAKTNRALKEYEEALNNLVKILNSSHPEKCHAKLELARLYESMGEDIKAEHYYTNLIESSEPNSYIALYDLINLQIKRGNTKKAIENIKKIEGNIEPINVEYLYGKFYMATGNHKKARNYFYKILQDGSKYKLKVPHDLALMKYVEDKYEEAIKMEEDLIKKCNFPYRDSVILLVDCYLKLKNKEKALEYIDILKENPYYTMYDDLNYMMGKLALIDFKWDEALALFSKVEKRNNTAYRDVLYKKCCVYVKKNQLDLLEETLKELDKMNIKGRYDSSIKKMHTYLNVTKYNKIDTTSDMGYIDLQIIEFSKEKAIEHISLHKKEDPTKINHSVFNENIDIEELYDSVQSKLTDENFSDTNLVDCYYIDYEDIGYENDIIANSLKIITLPNSKKIVAMYPYVKKVKLEKTKSKVKRMSQIDKFNQKYNIK